MSLYESLRHFQWVYKETNGAKWVHTLLYKNKAIFICVFADQRKGSQKLKIV